MKIPTIFGNSLVLLLILFEVHTKKLDLTTNESTLPASVLDTPSSKASEAPSQAKKKRYATREIILYLTPSQIKALEAGEGLVSLQSLSGSVGYAQPTNQDLKLQEQTEFVKQEFENIKSASIQEDGPLEENLELASQEPILQKGLLSTEHKQKLNDQWRQELANQEEELKLRNYYHELDKAEQLKLQQEVNSERNAWLTHNPNIQINEGYRVQEPVQDDDIEGKKKFQLKALSPLPLYEQNSEIVQTPKPLLQLQYAPKYNDQQRAIEIEQILRTHHQHELGKQNALFEAEKIANAPAIFVHDHVQITNQPPTPGVKHVQVPVPTPAWVSVPEFIPVRIPHHHNIESIEIEKPVPHNVGRPISSPFRKIVFFNVAAPYVH